MIADLTDLPRNIGTRTMSFSRANDLDHSKEIQAQLKAFRNSIDSDALEAIEATLRPFKDMTETPAKYWHHVADKIFQPTLLELLARHQVASDHVEQLLLLMIQAETHREFARRQERLFVGTVLDLIDERIGKFREDEALSGSTWTFVRRQVFRWRRLLKFRAAFNPEAGTWRDWIVKRIDWAISDWWKQFRNIRLLQNVTINQNSTEHVALHTASDSDDRSELEFCMRLNHALDQLSDPQRASWTLQKCYYRLLKRKDYVAMSRYSRRPVVDLKPDVLALRQTLVKQDLDGEARLRKRLQDDIRAQAKLTKLQFQRYHLTQCYRQLQIKRVSLMTLGEVQALSQSSTLDEIENNWEQLQRNLSPVDVQRGGDELQRYTWLCSAVRQTSRKVEIAQAGARKLEGAHGADQIAPASQQMADILDKGVSAVETAISRAKENILAALKSDPSVSDLVPDALPD